MMKFLLDTNIFIEAFKHQKEAQQLLELLIENSERIDIYISFNVIEETTFLLIKRNTKTGYWQLKKNKSLVIENFKKVKPHLELILNLCKVLYPTKKVLFKSFYYIESYGLLPNDALVLSFCKIHNIPNLISLDTDFSEVAKKEKINLITSLEDLKNLLV